jgi:hypothetical protein
MMSMTRVHAGIAAALSALLTMAASCATPTAAVTHTDFGQSVHDIRVQGGTSLPPDQVRELFDKTAHQICQTVDAKTDYEVLVMLEQPSTVEPLWDMPEGPMQQRLARRHYDVYRSNMEGKILCK